jgi:hypothetical protein
VEWQENLITEWINPHHGIPNLAKFRSLVSLRRVILDQSQYLLFKQAPIDELLKLLAENIDICPQLTSITAAECPSSWPRFLCHLRRRNLEAMLSRSTKCIEELSFSQPIHAVIIRWFMEAVKAMIFNVTERRLFVKGMLGRCVPSSLEGTSAYSAAAISVISRGWSSAVSCMRLSVWIVVGSEVMVRG